MIWWLVLQGAVVLLWAFLAFRALSRLTARLCRETGQMLPGPRQSLHGARLFFTDDQFAEDRRQLRLVTVLLIAMTAGFGLIQSRG